MSVEMFNTLYRCYYPEDRYSLTPEDDWTRKGRLQLRCNNCGIGIVRNAYRRNGNPMCGVCMNPHYGINPRLLFGAPLIVRRLLPVFLLALGLSACMNGQFEVYNPCPEPTQAQQQTIVQTCISLCPGTTGVPFKCVGVGAVVGMCECDGMTYVIDPNGQVEPLKTEETEVGT